MKKTTLALALFFILAFAPHVLAQGFVPLAEIPGLTSGEVANAKNLVEFFQNLYKYLIGLAAILAIIMIIWGGLEYSTQDSVPSKSNAKQRIGNAIFGLVLVLSPVLVFSIINPSILNLQLNLLPLETKSGTSNGSGTPGSPAQPAPLTTPASGCTSRKGPYLETASCATESAANSYACSNGAPLTVPTCGTRNAQGVCVGNITAYCGKTTTVQYYRATVPVLGHIATGAFGLIGSANVIPRDATIQNEFAAGCSADGGVMQSDVGKLSFTFASRGNCPTDSGVPNFQTGGLQNGWACATQYLSCVPK